MIGLHNYSAACSNCFLLFARMLIGRSGQGLIAFLLSDACVQRALFLEDGQPGFVTSAPLLALPTTHQHPALV
jgi:hypothetical protein